MDVNWLRTETGACVAVWRTGCAGPGQAFIRITDGCLIKAKSGVRSWSHPTVQRRGNKRSSDRRWPRSSGNRGNGRSGVSGRDSTSSSYAEAEWLSQAAKDLGLRWITDEEWQVEEIPETRKTGGATKVLVKWTGYAQATWKPMSAFLETEALDRYEAAPHEDHGGPRNAGRGGEQCNGLSPAEASATLGQPQPLMGIPDPRPPSPGQRPHRIYPFSFIISACSDRSQRDELATFSSLLFLVCSAEVVAI